MKVMKAEVDQDKKKKNQIRVQRCRQKLIEENLNVFREAESIGRQQRRTQELSHDQDKYRKKQASEKQTQRAEKMKIDPEGFRETESTSQQQQKTQEMSENLDYYKKKRAS